jgi:poly(beta-D-mannuronate) lyase
MTFIRIASWFAWVTIVVLFVLAKADAAEHRVSTAAEIAAIANQLRPGDVIFLADGTWTDQAILFRAKGSANKPITLRAQTYGKVILTGASSLTIDGEHLIASGLYFKNGTTASDGVALKGHDCRLLETAIVDCTYKFYVRLYGDHNRVDHCYLAGKTSESPTLQVEAEGQPNHHRIDHNHFGPRPPLGRNGGETIRVGYSHQSMNNSSTIVEHNLFDRCDGELEIISSKSCNNIYRYNTFLDCAGMLTLRHGNRCRVEANYFIAHHKRGSGGIRVIGEEHTVINNYIDGVTQGGIWITSGIPNSELRGYFQARDCLIAFNTIVDSAGPCLQLDAGIGSSGRTLRPENITVANNVLSPGEGGSLLKGTEGAGWKWLANLASASRDNSRTAQNADIESKLSFADIKLTRADDGLWRLVADSPARAAAANNFPKVTTDIDGQPRGDKPDVGCDQFSDAAIDNPPLTAADVGPAWLDRTDTKKAEQRQAFW